MRQFFPTFVEPAIAVSAAITVFSSISTLCATWIKLSNLTPRRIIVERLIYPDFTDVSARAARIVGDQAGREARDDRLVVALDLGSDAYYYRDWVTDEDKEGDSEAKEGRFTVAYVVRAVTPGTFTLPEAVVEDMYRPGVMARTAAGQARVVEP